MQYDKGVQSEARTLSLRHSGARDHCVADIEQKGLNKAAILVGFFPSSPREFFVSHTQEKLGYGLWSLKFCFNLRCGASQTMALQSRSFVTRMSCLKISLTLACMKNC